jgi:hypothetical protein
VTLAGLTAVAAALALILANSSGKAPDVALFAVLLGGNEVGAGGEARAGDRDGRGSATVLVGATRLCFGITVARIGKPVLAHIHRGGAGVNGLIVVPLRSPATGNPGASSGCVHGLNSSLLNEIRANPAGFYVTVHTRDHPAGAIRGQLF